MDKIVVRSSHNLSLFVGVGDDPGKALRDAESKGHENAVILYVPEKDTVHIYLLDSAKALRH